MGDRVEFDINDALKNYLSDPSAIATPEAPADLQDCENDPDSLTAPTVNAALNPVVHAVADSPDAITRSEVFDTLQCLLKYATPPSQKNAAF